MTWRRAAVTLEIIVGSSQAFGDAGKTMLWHVRGSSERAAQATRRAPQADLEDRWNAGVWLILPQACRNDQRAPAITFGRGWMATSIAAESLSLSSFAPAVLRPVAFHLSTSPSWYVLITLIHTTYTTDLHPQAHRIITQVVFTGARVFGRAFAEAYKQASASQVCC